jgi:hypothetical protein
MTPDLTYLAYPALLLGVLWIPYFVGQTMANGFLTPENHRDPTMPGAPLWRSLYEILRSLVRNDAAGIASPTANEPRALKAYKTLGRRRSSDIDANKTGRNTK